MNETEYVLVQQTSAEEIKRPKSWQEFRRMRGLDCFWGCVDKDGYWFDSSVLFEAALLWCYRHAGHSDDASTEEILEWIGGTRQGDQLPYSIIHSSMLEKMYEAGLIK